MTMDEINDTECLRMYPGLDRASCKMELQPYQRAAMLALTDPDFKITDLPRGGKMIDPATAAALREHPTRDIGFAAAAAKDLSTAMVIAEALEMQRRGRPAPLPRPTYLAVAIRAIYDDIESWSSTK